MRNTTIKLTLVTLAAYFAYDFWLYHRLCEIRRAAGESDYERGRMKDRIKNHVRP